MSRAPIVGIDLGTTHSLVAYVAGGRPRVVTDEHGRALLPSVAAYEEDGGVSVGYAARERGVTEPERTVYSVKRLLGRSAAEVAGITAKLPYAVDGDGGRLAVRIGGRRITPEEVSAAVLGAVRARAEAHFGAPVTDAVITVPAYFDDAQRQATRDAAKLAGLRVLRILNEPTAAALAYGLHEKKEGVIAVYDLGGGTFDISILQVSAGIFRVLATHGDTLLGGDDFDAALAALARERLGVTAESPAVRRALLTEAVRVKHALTAAGEAEFAFAGKAVVISRADFEAAVLPLVERTLASARRALADAAIAPHEIDEIVLVGGATRMPLLRERVGAYFGRKPHTELNPDEVVALGAAVQADILAGGADLVLLDVIPLSLGLETMGGAVARLIERNTTVPAAATQLFTTYADNQTTVDFSIVQGERELARDNRLLGRFKLRGIPPQLAGLPKIRVDFAVDESGILTVTALEERSGRRARVEVVPAFNLAPDAVDRLIEDAYDKAEDDYRARMLADIRVETEIMLRATARALGAPGAAVDAAERAAIEHAADRLRDAARRDDYRAIKNAYDALNAASREFAERLMDAAVHDALAQRRVDDVS